MIQEISNMPTGNLMLLVISVCTALCFALYLLPMSLTQDYDYVNVKKYKYLIRLLDFYFRAIPVGIIGGTLFFILVFIIPLLVIMPINIFFKVTFINPDDELALNMVCLYSYLVIIYNIIRFRYIK